MRIPDIVQLAFRSLLRTKGRAALTMLGIVIGIASVILTLSIGRAAESFLLSQVASFGSDLIFIANGRGDVDEAGPPSNTIKMTLTYQDYQDLRRQSWTRLVDPALIQTDLATYGAENMYVQVAGAGPDEIPTFNSLLATGRFLEDTDLVSHARVIVLGANVATRLYGQSDPLHTQVKIGKRNYRVIGVMAPGGTRFFSSVDDQVYIPVTSAMDAYNKDRLNFLSVKPIGIGVREATDRIRLLLRENHHIENPSGDLSKDDFRVATQEDAARNAATIGRVLQILLGSIAGISLVVGGIGIMNIMFVTVTERTREIGLRKALGATRRDVLGQFFAEAILLTVIGGAIGILIGLGISWIAVAIIRTFQDGWTFHVPTQAVVLAFSVSVITGVIFGYYPAKKAARLRPIESLRYE